MSRRSKKNKPAKQSSAEVLHPKANKSTQIIEQSFSGPIPAPAILEQYDKLLPGAADRILSMAESDAKHQREIEMAAITFQAKENRRGQYFGVFVVIIAFITSGVALFLGHAAAASVIGGATVVGLATAFVIGRKFK